MFLCACYVMQFDISNPIINYIMKSSGIIFFLFKGLFNFLYFFLFFISTLYRMLCSLIFIMTYIKWKKTLLHNYGSV